MHKSMARGVKSRYVGLHNNRMENAARCFGLEGVKEDGQEAVVGVRRECAGLGRREVMRLIVN